MISGNTVFLMQTFLEYMCSMCEYSEVVTLGLRYGRIKSVQILL